jgi:hypothetical protein
MRHTTPFIIACLAILFLGSTGTKAQSQIRYKNYRQFRMLNPVKRNTFYLNRQHRPDTIDLSKTWWVQYNPFTLLEPELPITATFMYKINRKIAVALDAGFFIAHQDFQSDGYEKYSGIRLKPQIKIYPLGKQTYLNNWYLSLQGVFKYTQNPEQQWLTKLDANGQFLYRQLVDYTQKKREIGIDFLMGFELPLNYEKTWMLDFYMGMGTRNKTFTEVGIPLGLAINRNDFFRFFTINRPGEQITLPAGLKLSYRFKSYQ